MHYKPHPCNVARGTSSKRRAAARPDSPQGEKGRGFSRNIATLLGQRPSGSIIGARLRFRLDKNLTQLWPNSLALPSRLSPSGRPWVTSLRSMSASLCAPPTLSSSCCYCFPPRFFGFFRGGFCVLMLCCCFVYSRQDDTG